MTQTRIVYYRELSGQVPMQRWFNGLPEDSRTTCCETVGRLRKLGKTLGFPHTHPLRGGIHELRMRVRRLRYRIFYFWHGGTVVLTHGITKKTAAVPQREITRALKRKRQFEQNPTLHTLEIDNG